MSLKHLHLVFISMCLGLMAFMGYWAVTMQRAGQPQPLLAVVGAAGLVASVAYLGWFLRKYRKLA